MNTANPISLYIHFPFCQKKCPYCDFYSKEPKNIDLEMQNYLANFEKEIAKKPRFKLKTIFLGGGTPSLMTIEHLEKLLYLLKNKFSFNKNFEFSIEVNPESADLKKFIAYKKLGINRISIGAQSFNDDILKQLGRIHDTEKIYQAYNFAQKAGFLNINLDLIFAIKGQSLETWQKTLEKAISLDPSHISIYNLTIKHGTQAKLKDQELDFKMYKLAIKTLQNNRYIHYEISNFAKRGFLAKHNMTYWHNDYYLGIGKGAKSSKSSSDYKMTAILGLRLLKEGVNLKRFFKKHQLDFLKTFEKVIAKLKKQNLVLISKRKVVLSKKAIPIANHIFEEFL